MNTFQRALQHIETFEGHKKLTYTDRIAMMVEFLCEEIDRQDRLRNVQHYEQPKRNGIKEALERSLKETHEKGQGI